AGVLPVERVVHWPPRAAIPEDRRLALVGDPERAEIGRREVGLRESVGDHGQDIAPDLIWIVLDPARQRVVVTVLLLGDRNDAGAVVEDEASGRRRSLVDRDHVAA